MNLSHEDKQVFFSWLDEFFIKLTGGDSFVPKGQKQKPAPASKWVVPSSVKDTVASMVGERGQGPPVSTLLTFVCEGAKCDES